MGRFLKRGALAGGCGGLAAAVVLLVVGERSIEDALAIEEAASEGGGEELFSRTIQVVGGGLATGLYGVLLGVIFAVAYASVRHRSRLRDDFGRSVGLGAVGFVAVYLVTWLKYPPNPPAVGDPDTVNERTVAFLTLLAAAVGLAWVAWRASRALRARGWADHLRAPTVGFGYAAAAGLAVWIWPDSTDPVEIPATLLWRFRITALAGMATLWSVMATVHGWLWLRAQRREEERRELLSALG